MAQLSQEVQSVILFATRSGVPMRVTATLGTYISPTNPCSPHSPGSYHCKDGTNGKGLAVDFAETQPSHDTPGLLSIFALFASRGNDLAELIYYDAPYAIKDGKRVNGFAVYGATVMQAHRNHVHVAVPVGTLLTPLPKGSDQPMPDLPPDYELTGTPCSISAVFDSAGTVKGYYIMTDDGSIASIGLPYLGRVHKKP